MNIKHKTGKTLEFSYTLYWAEFFKNKFLIKQSNSNYLIYLRETAPFTLR